jgi:hypothetical protein
MTQTQTPFHCWNDLPAELKLEVAGHIITDASNEEEGDIPHYLDDIIATRNRELVDIVLNAWHKLGTFVVYIVLYNGTFKRPVHALAHKIRHLKVIAKHCDMFDDLDNTLLNPVGSWRWLLRPTRHLVDPGESTEDGPDYWGFLARRQRDGIPKGDWETNWQKMYTDLESIKIELHIHDQMIFHIQPGDEAYAEVFKVLLKETRIFFRAKKVVVTVRLAGAPHSPKLKEREELALCDVFSELGHGVEEKIRLTK